MNTEALFAQEHTLHLEAERLLNETRLMLLLERLGEVRVTGSFNTGLMVKPDIDFAIQAKHPRVQTAIDLLPRIFAEVRPLKVSLADFSKYNPESSDYYVGIQLLFNNHEWSIDATVGHPGPIYSSPPEVDIWLAAMTNEERAIILKLKKQLIKARRYVGSRSQPPYTFRSIHLYEAVLRGGAKTIREAEAYFTGKT